MSAVLELAARSAGWTSLLLLLRIAPIGIALPAFGGPGASPAVRSGVVLVLCVALWPAAPIAPEPGASAALVVAASQLALGLLTALGTLVVFEAARTVGAIADTVLGRGSFGAADPLGAAPSGPLATLYALAVVAVFAATGSHRLLLAGMDRSLELFALDATLGSEAFRTTFGQGIRLFSGAFAAAVALAVPVLAAGLIVDVSFGWLGRSMPQFPALFLAMPTRMLLGWTVVAATLAGGTTWLAAATVEAFAAMAAGGG